MWPDGESSSPRMVTVCVSKVRVTPPWTTSVMSSAARVRRAERPAGERVIDRLPGELAGAAAEDRLRRAVQVGEPALRIDDQHAVAEVLDARVAQRRNRIEHPVVEDGDHRADARAGEEKGRRIDVGDRVGLHQEHQVAEPRQQRGRDEDAAAPRVEVRRLERPRPEDADPDPQRGVGEDDVDVEAGAAADQQLERPRPIDRDRPPEPVMPPVGPGEQEHRHREGGEDPHRLADPRRLGADEIEHEPDPDGRNRGDAEVFDLENEDFVGQLAGRQLPRVGDAPVRDRRQQQGIPPRRPDAAVQHRVHRDRQQRGRPDE